jgi:hypothetical protein
MVSGVTRTSTKRELIFRELTQRAALDRHTQARSHSGDPILETAVASLQRADCRLHVSKTGRLHRIDLVHVFIIGVVALSYHEVLLASPRSSRRQPAPSFSFLGGPASFRGRDVFGVVGLRMLPIAALRVLLAVELDTLRAETAADRSPTRLFFGRHRLSLCRGRAEPTIRVVSCLLAAPEAIPFAFGLAGRRDARSGRPALLQSVHLNCTRPFRTAFPRRG